MKLFDMWRKKVIVVLVVCGVVCMVALWISSLKKDLAMTVIQKAAQAEWELGGISTIRTIGSDVWEINSQRVIRRPSIECFFGISAKITGPSGQRTVHSPEGEYNSKQNSLELHDAFGDWERQDHPLTWRTKRAFWTQKDDTWKFSGGVSVKSDVYALDAENAVMVAQKKISAENGTIRWWSE